MCNTVDSASLETHRSRARRAWDVGDAIVFVASGLPVPIHGTDGLHGFHVHGDHLWLCGLDAPGQVVAYDPADGFTLFAHVATREERVWEGDTADLAEVAARTGLEDIRDRAGLADWIGARSGRPVALLGNPDLAARPEAYGAPGLELSIDADLSAACTARLSECRRKKSVGEVGVMAGSAAAASVGHVLGMTCAEAGMTERRLAGMIEAEFRVNGAKRVAYETIVGSGPNSAILHYAAGERPLAEGDLVLVDAGAEFGGYMSDITRTFPVSGRFTAEQADVYDLVLAVQEAAIARARPGTEYRDIHLEACTEIARGLADLGILRGNPESLVERDAHALFFPHGLGHLIGIATHDVGGYLEGRTRSERFGLRFLRTDLPLEEGYVVTIEPGIYFIRALLEDGEMRRKYADCVAWDRVDGMLDFGGIRIEDDVLVTDDGPHVLSSGAPKAREEIEAMRGRVAR